MLTLNNDDDADQLSDGYAVWERSGICEWTVSGLHWAKKQWWILGYEVLWLYSEGLGVGAGSRDPATILLGLAALQAPYHLSTVTTFTNSDGVIRLKSITSDCWFPIFFVCIDE